MSSPRWLIGLIMLFVICTIVSNIIEQQAILTTTQVAELQGMTEQEIVSIQDPDTGGTGTSGSTPLSIWQNIWKALWAEYTFFYNVDYTVAEGDCTGTWDDDIGACRTPNDWMIVRYIFFWPMTVAMFVEIILTIRRIIGGG